MKTVTVTRRSRQLQDLLEIAQEEDVVVQTADGDAFLLSMIDEFSLEVAQQRRDRKLMAFLKERFHKAREEKGVSLDQVRQELGLIGEDSKKEKTRRRKARSGAR